MSTQSIHMAGYARNGAAEIRRPAARALFGAVLIAFRQKVARFIHERALRRAENELMRLDYRMLKDIGLDRSEISSAVRNAGGERLNGAQPSASES